MEVDFTYERPPKGRILALEMIHDRFVRMFRITLSGALRKPIDITVRSTELIKFGEFLKYLPVPSSLNLYRMDPLKGTGIMVLETRLVFNLIDIFYGGTGEQEAKAKGRDFTPIEQRLVKRVVIAALEDLQTAWKPILKVQASYQRTEINPQFVAVVPQNHLVIVVTFNVEMGNEPMTLTLCFPYAMIRPLMFYFKAKSVLMSPFVQNLTDIVDLGYKLTPLPPLMKKVTKPIKQIFKKKEPVEMITTPGKLNEDKYKKPPLSNQGEQSPPLAVMQDLDPTIIAVQICNEHPQTIALILSHLIDRKKTAEVIQHLPNDLQADVTHRMAILEHIPPGVITEIEAVLDKGLEHMAAHINTQIGGIEPVAEVLDAMDEKTADSIMKLIRDSNPKLADALENSQRVKKPKSTGKTTAKKAKSQKKSES